MSIESKQWWTDEDWAEVHNAIASANWNHAAANAVIKALGPTVERIRREALREAADIVQAEHEAEKRRLARYDDQSGLLGNWLGGIRCAEKVIRGRIEADQ